MRIRLCRRPQLLLFLPQGTHFPCPDRVLRHKYSWQLKKFLRHANPTSEVSDAIHHSIKLTAKSRISHRSVAQFVDIALSQVLKLPKVKSFNALPAVAAIDYPFNKMPRLEKKLFPPDFPPPRIFGDIFWGWFMLWLKSELLWAANWKSVWLHVLVGPPHISPCPSPSPFPARLKRLPNKVEKASCMSSESFAFELRFLPGLLVCRARHLKDLAAVLVTVTILGSALAKVIYDPLMPSIQNSV